MPVMAVTMPTTANIMMMPPVILLMSHIERRLKWLRTLSTKYVTIHHHISAPAKMNRKPTA